MHNYSWDDLRYILAVADTGSVNAAAKRLNVNHATVLRRLAAFEDKHGVSCFLKSPQGYTLDPAYQNAIATIRDIDAKADAFSRAIVSVDTRLVGDIHVTSTDSICDFVLPEVIQEIAKDNPGLRVHLSVSNDHLDLGKLDAEFTIRPAMSLPDDLIGQDIGELVSKPYATAEYLDQNPGSDVADHRWFSVDGPLMRSPMGSWQSKLPTQKIVGSATSFLTLMRLASTGMGVAILPCCVGDNAPDLKPVTALDIRFAGRLFIATHKDLADNPRLIAAMALFTKALQARRKIFAPD